MYATWTRNWLPRYIVQKQPYRWAYTLGMTDALSSHSLTADHIYFCPSTGDHTLFNCTSCTEVGPILSIYWTVLIGSFLCSTHVTLFLPQAWGHDNQCHMWPNPPHVLRGKNKRKKKKEKRKKGRKEGKEHWTLSRAHLQCFSSDLLRQYLW